MKKHIPFYRRRCKLWNAHFSANVTNLADVEQHIGLNKYQDGNAFKKNENNDKDEMDKVFGGKNCWIQKLLKSFHSIP